ncbi:glycogen debranching protein [Christiangramia sediminis]|uniref:Glycogen debranching protein n=1 Tax=Christiangramia sediminis TaxID=2881336 RepID=A0A9X1LHK1_9FLAO|nr:glycogen debranching protein [Christiangramia sediminis]MCB7480462.1 glycogen debranching protein [Christiangramia sediminis]
MKEFFLMLFPGILAFTGFAQTKNIPELIKGAPSIEGKTEYLNSPFVEAGDRLYVVGHQDGSFPELGWHIPGEMGGVWNHPIKLFDGFETEIIVGKDTIILNRADAFINYPIASQHKFKLEKQNLSVDRWQFVSDKSQSLAIQLVLINHSGDQQELQLIFKAFSDLRPTWLGEKTDMVDGPDKAAFNANTGYWVIKDSISPWSANYRAEKEADFNKIIPSEYKGMGTGTLLGYNLSIPPNQKEVITFYLAGSYNSVSESIENFRNIEKNLEKEIIVKKEKYQKLASKSKLTIEDKELQQTFEWLKYNSAWLVQEVPEIGTGITAGIPDYPWWFGVDSEYALKGYMAVGQKEAVYKTIKLLDSVSMAVNGNGKIIHEMSTNGAVFNKGNINETPQFASLIWEVYKWNGNREFLKEYFPTIKKGLKWLLEENDKNNNLFPDGFGMMEIHGLDSEMIDVAVYTQRAFEDAARIAAELDQKEIYKKYTEIASQLKNKINSEFWSAEFGSYADFIGTDEQAIRLIEDAIVRADTLNKPWSVKELKDKKKYILNNPSREERPFVLHHNWVVNTPMEMKIADPEKAKIALKTAEKFTNPFGVFVTGIDRDEQVSKDEASFKGSKSFSYTGAVMTLPTGVQVIAENNYGNPDKALDYLQRMSRSFSYAFPGSMYEVSPDYGMITQAWNIYSFAIPVVQQFFGVQPMTSEKLVTIKPQMPAEWNPASLENVEMGDNEISVYHTGSSVKVTKTNPDWKIKLIMPKASYHEPESNIQLQEDGESFIFSTSANEMEIRKKLSN